MRILKITANSYTSLLSFGISDDAREKLYGKPISLADREFVEERSDVLSTVELKYYTTIHTNLVVRVKKLGVDVKILDREAILEVKDKREIPEIKPRYIIQLKLDGSRGYGASAWLRLQFVLFMTLQNASPGLDYERDNKFSKMIASCLVKDPSKRHIAKELLKYYFFKQARSNDYIARKLLDGLPALVNAICIGADPVQKSMWKFKKTTMASLISTTN
ncbi:hypothetical protein OROMI_013676 [Orobanche minor]